jgi:hypothetical protein
MARYTKFGLMAQMEKEQMAKNKFISLTVGINIFEYIDYGCDCSNGFNFKVGGD